MSAAWAVGTELSMVQVELQLDAGASMVRLDRNRCIIEAIRDELTPGRGVSAAAALFGEIPQMCVNSRADRAGAGVS